MQTITSSARRTLKYARIYLFLALTLGYLTTQGQPIDIQGHRGARGLMPENTIPAFIKALEIGVTTLELDVVISQDQEVVVSHEPYLSHLICKAPDGSPISEDQEQEYNLYQMPYATIRQSDCGSLPHPRFPEQKKMVAHKPLLRQVIEAAEQYVATHALPPVQYNIEIKSTESGDSIFHPVPTVFAALVLAVIDEKEVADRVTIQSFDVRALQATHELRPNMRLALLVENTDSPQKNIARLGFTPQIYSPYFKLVDEKLIDFAKTQRMQVIPWTVNEPEDIKAMLDLGADGIISDYPDRAVQISRVRVSRD